ncbi:class II glutamine amidotransferase [Sulfurisphaera ohwakuensis]|uniref:Glutamine amidotransferase n=1 Tax=Sulfurisphaera ohwakuensis TaxID=69656 RepID=A0A650CKG2_SULOH|nr:class II glutamine amidotransferase [Sulfurisphaera ohwakuensis]MBB5253891.1 glutamine amidotransferase [Sulfurisphaera ohwakuensis]QGR17957.1 class II glutamine amidotransferase [Sulfurisphaera ohwakuensis]
MCRILAFKAKGEPNFEVLKAFLSASKNDVYFKYGSHSDGWGFIALISKNGKWKVLYYKTNEPIYEDPLFFDYLSLLKGDEIYAIFHARKAGKNFLLGVRHNHPYYYRLSTHDLYFAHNGSINRKAFSEPNYPSTDSYLFFLEIIKNYSLKNDFKTAYLETLSTLSQYASSLNSALLTFNNQEGPRIFVGYYYNKNRMKEIEEYYKLYRYENYIFSSTVGYYLGKNVEELSFSSINEISG